MPIVPFEASKLKIQRSRRHIDEFTQTTSDYLQRSPCSTVVEADGPGQAKWVVRLYEPPPPELAPILGDAIHNLRAALDLMACEIVAINGGSSKGVYFPFAESAAELDDRIKDRNFHRASPEAIALLKSLQPHKGGNFALRAIHDLDVMDKHKSLIPTFTAAVLPPFAIGTNRFFGTMVPLADGQTIMSFPIHPGITIGQSQPATPEVQFAYDHPFAHEPVIPRLHSLAELVDDIVQAFEMACFGKQSEPATQ